MKRHTLTLLFVLAASMIGMSSKNCSAKTIRVPGYVPKPYYVAKPYYVTKPYYIATRPYIATPHYGAVKTVVTARKRRVARIGR